MQWSVSGVVVASSTMLCIKSIMSYLSWRVRSPRYFDFFEEHFLTSRPSRDLVVAEQVLLQSNDNQMKVIKGVDYGGTFQMME